MKRLRIFLLCLFFYVQPALSADSNIMPKGFEQIELGMDWASFLAIRPDVKIFMSEFGERSTPDPNQPRGGLIETFPDGSEFSTGFYVFEQGRLVASAFGRPLKAPSQHRKIYLRTFANRYGIPSTVHLTHSPLHHGIMVWHNGDRQVHAIVPLSSKVSPEDGVMLRILTHAYTERLELVKPDEETNSTRTSVETAALDALMQEMITYANEANTSGNHSENSQEQPKE